MPKFLFLMHRRAGITDELSPDQMQDIVRRHRAWVQQLTAGGAYLASELLAKDGRIVRATEDRLDVSDGPYVESKEIVAGFYLVKAEDYASAVVLARDCPGVALGPIEIRQIVEP